MRIHLARVDDTELDALLTRRAAHSHAHTLADDPAHADMILLLGSFGRDPSRLLDHPLYKSMPLKCAVFTEDDNYLPLAPGLYASAQPDESTRIGRVYSHSYPSAAGMFGNTHVAPRPVPKQYLFSFLGGSTSLLRKRLFNIPFNRPDVLVEDTSTYLHWATPEAGQSDRDARQQRYAQIIAASHFVLCPRGAGVGSIRFFETMQAGVAPVLLADKYLLPAHVDWSAFLLRFEEKDIARLPALLEPFRDSAAERGRLARLAWEQYFSPEKEFDAIVEGCASALHNAAPFEAKFQSRQRAMIARLRRKQDLYGLARNAVLKTLKLLRIKNPYRMNQEK